MQGGSPIPIIIGSGARVTKELRPCRYVDLHLPTQKYV